MLYSDNIKVEFESQGFRCTHLGCSPEADKTALFFESMRKTETVSCPECGGEVHIYTENLSEEKSESLQTILQEHHDLAVCYAMKEEMCRLYELTDYQQALDGWTKWFEAAKASEIPALVKFAKQKEKRLLGLAAHAVFPISTGKLEGFNNKIKVAKRIAYGYRNEDYFFTLIRYLSLPSARCSSHNFP